MRLLNIGLIGLLALAAAIPSTASILAPAGLSGVVPNDGEVAPFGAGDLGGLYITGWQQIYDASLFGGPTTIAGLRFFRTQFTDPNYNSINDSTYTISLITTTLGIDQLDPTSLAANAVSQTIHSAPFFSGQLSGTAGSTLTISGSPYSYDPAQGNLLIYITKPGNSIGPSLFLDYAQDPSAPFSMATELSHTFDPNDPAANVIVNLTDFRGLATEFLTPADLAVPEPGTFVPLAFGTVAMLTLFRMRRRSD